jgi:hypothetical protein
MCQMAQTAVDPRPNAFCSSLLDAYIALAGIADQADAPLWQNAPGHGGKLSGGVTCLPLFGPSEA